MGGTVGTIVVGIVMLSMVGAVVGSGNVVTRHSEPGAQQLVKKNIRRAAAYMHFIDLYLISGCIFCDGRELFKAKKAVRIYSRIKERASKGDTVSFFEVKAVPTAYLYFGVFV